MLQSPTMLQICAEFPHVIGYRAPVILDEATFVYPYTADIQMSSRRFNWDVKSPDDVVSMRCTTQ